MKQTVSIQMDGGHIANKTLVDSNGSNGFTISRSYEEFVFSDVQEMLFKGKTP
jgi:hypothetical protein